jgi:hypothetical protein
MHMCKWERPNAPQPKPLERSNTMKHADKTGNTFTTEELLGMTVSNGGRSFIVRKAIEAQMWGVCLEGRGIRSFVRLCDSTVIGRMPVVVDDSPNKTLEELLTF